MVIASRVLLSLVALTIVVAVVVFDPSGLVAFDLPKSLALHALAWPTAAVIVLLIGRNGIRLIPRTRLHLAVVAVVAVSLASSVVAENRYLALFGEQDRYLGLVHLSDMALLYLACAIAVREPRHARAILGAIAVAALVAIGSAASQALGLDPYSWEADPRMRPFATFGNANKLALFLSVALGAFLGIAAAPSWPARVLGMAGTLCSVAAIAGAASRGSLLGFAGVLGAFVLWRRPTWKAFGMILLAAVALGVVVLATPLGGRALATTQANVGDRLVIYEAAARATAARPLFGYGPDNFRGAYAEHRSTRALAVVGEEPETSAHSLLLDAAAGTGLLGAAALVLLIGTGTLELARLARTRPEIGGPLLLGWAGYWAHGLVSIGTVSVAWFPWVALGTAAGLSGARSSRAIRDLGRLTTVAVLVATMVVGIAIGARAFLANRDEWVARSALLGGDAAAAVAAADRALARDAGRAGYWNRLGVALARGGATEDAALAFREAVRREPREATFWENLARELARLALAGDARAGEEAIAAARRATIVAPTAPSTHTVLAEVAIALGRCDIARDAAARVTDLSGSNPPIVTRAAACRAE